MRLSIKKILLALLLLLLLFTGIFSTEIRQFYHTVRLFDADVIVHNFSHMEEVAPTAVISRQAPVNQFGSAPEDLPETFVYKGQTRNMADFLTASSTTALVVLKGNNVTFEDYYQGTGKADYRISWSMAKSFLSALFGIAVEEGYIKDLNAPVTDYVPELKGSGYEGVSIKNVLQMSSGVYFNEDYGDFNSDINRFGRVMALGGSFDDFAASLTSEREQGNFMHYVSIDTHVIGMVLRAATQRRLVDYFNDKLWSKLGTEQDAIYITDSTGEPMVLGGLNLMARDYARMGALYRDSGVLNGQQIVPAQWIEDSITPDAPHLMPGERDSANTNLGYGYQWWIPENPDQEFMALGIYGQYIFVDRKNDVVIVKNSADRNFMANDYESTDIAIAAFRAISASLAQPAVAKQ
ncbi:beta-lactamase family protein [Aestuariirhabdus sp. Z084]|uniref:serine hydrolase domain-containing protein n=1 Tax=Aestuariirhabdus haliotis TaxID=2918751 RepID=UPI00201B439A|nr:serine hydrolase [Aestuariirhabdus haliotis]MCL6416811.1 beta-lactamase family protein [Aestuariirhabdus haliotis]MCL6420811.1 beta-lactamase family protein [Aestuariirhabdus haliotis]